MNNLPQWKSTITGIITLVLAVLVGFGILSPDDSIAAGGFGAQTVEGVAGVIGGLAGLYQIFFQKD